MKTKTILLTLTTLFAAAESGDAQTAPNDKKVLVAYFSHSGNTRAVAERIAAATVPISSKSSREALPRGVPRRRRSGRARSPRSTSGAENRPARRRAIRRVLHRFALLVVDRRTARRDLPRSARLHGQDPHPLHDARREPAWAAAKPTSDGSAPARPCAAASPSAAAAQRRPTAKSDSSSRRPDAECGRHADGRNRTGECESQSAAQGGRRWRAHRNPTKAIFADKHKNT